MKITTIGELKKLIAGMPDDVQIIKQNNETGCIEAAYISDVTGCVGMCSFSPGTGQFTSRYLLVK